MRALAALLALSAALLAQTDANKGQISGVVLDANQAVIPNVPVKVRNTATGLERQMNTNEAGQYRAVLLDPGAYDIEATASGFAPAKIEGVQVTVGSAIVLDIVMQVGSTATTIEVGATLINVAPAPSATLNNQAITNLPINGRRFQDFAVLTPTVQLDPSRGQLTFAGQRGINSNIMLDGADYNQPFFGGIRGGERSGSIITVPQSAIQEFQVVTTGYSAEYGRSTGGVLNTITKSGGNDIHGEAFYQLRHKELGAKDPVQLIASLETLQQFGGAIGGPIKKDKLFFFGAGEVQRSRTPRRVLFAQLLNRATTPATKEAFDFFKSEEKPFNQTNNASAITARIDHQSQKGHRLTLRYNFSDASAENAVSVGGALDPFTNRAFSNDGIEKDRIHNGTAQYTRLLSPTMVNDFRAGASYEQRPRLANSATPQIDARPIGLFGARNFLPTVQDDKRIQFNDGLSISRGAHTMKFGIDYNYITTFQSFGFNQFGGFVITSSNVDEILDVLGTGGSIPNRFDSRTVTYQRQIGNLLASFNMHQIAAFAQDSWRINSRLQLDFGLRWEAQRNPGAEANNQSVVDRVNGFRFPNGMTVDPTKIQNNYKQFMPRLGIAWTPVSGSHRTVVRAHTGLFYASTPLIVFAGPTNNFRLPPGDVSITLAPTATQTVYQQLLAAGVDLNRTPLDQLPAIPLDVVQRASQLALGGQTRDPFAGAALLAAARDFQNPRAFQTGAGVETEVFKNFVAGAQFNLLNTVHLQRNQDYNLPAPFIRAGDLSQRPTYGLRTGGLRPIPSLGSITVRASSARSMYRGVTLSGQYRAKKLQFGAFYTWSQTFSDDDTERDASGFNYADPANFRADYWYSRNDIRHQYTSYATYPLPWGFEVSGIVRARSGQVINPVTGGDQNEEFGTNDRPYGAPGVSLQRNSFRNRAVYNDDFRVLKNFKLGDVRRIQFSAEFFNLLNLDNVVYANANGSILTGGIYGLGIGTNGQSVAIDPRFQRLRLPDGTYDRNNQQIGTPLQIQFGLRFFF
ncbi:MAG: carboxypeptidase regulatory-like domain-containing protein [Bryobacteraceae bacterium]